MNLIAGALYTHLNAFFTRRCFRGANSSRLIGRRQETAGDRWFYMEPSCTLFLTTAGGFLLRITHSSMAKDEQEALSCWTAGTSFFNCVFIITR